MSKLSANAKGALSIGIVAIIYLIDGMELNIGTVGMPGEGFVPRVMGVFLLFCCAALLVQEMVSPKESEAKNQASEEAPDAENARRPIWLMIALLIYAAVLPILGFVLSTLVLMLASLRIFEYRNWIGSCMIAAAATAVTYFVFEKWLQILFPPGFWG